MLHRAAGKVNGHEGHGFAGALLSQSFVITIIRNNLERNNLEVEGRVISTYRLFPATDGPAHPVSYDGSFLSGVLFEVTSGDVWLEGYSWWVCPSGQNTAKQKFALWNVTGAPWYFTGDGPGKLIPGSVVTSDVLTPGRWNHVALSAPILLSVGTTYNACTGFTGPFPDTNNMFGAGQPYGDGITKGPLTAFSAQSGTFKEPYGNSQGVFGTAGTDPSVYMPLTGSGTDNFWMDIQVTDTAPAEYAGSYRLWPHKFDASVSTGPDDNVNYVVATEVHLSQSCALNKIWYYSPPQAAQLATECGVWDISTRQLVVTDDSPSWSGEAGSGWISCSFRDQVLPAGKYRVAVYNGAARPVSWSAKDLNYWDTGSGRNGITNGPISAPALAKASPANIYQQSGQEPGQCVFAVGPPNQYPNEYVDGIAQNYWVDMEITPVSGTPVHGHPASSAGFLTFFP